MCALALPLLLTLAILTPPAAVATDVVGTGYTASPLKDGLGNSYTCSTWSGGSDANGRSYLPCGSNILIVNAAGALVGKLTLPDGWESFRDVAPTADGSTVYWVAGGADIDVPDPVKYPNYGILVRASRQADGSWTFDEGYRFGRVQIGASAWSVRNIAADLAGNVYVTVNAYIYVLDPNGHQIAVMGGDDGWSPEHTYLGGLEVGEGLDVTPDGTGLYVVEQRHNHIERWDRSPDGSWHRADWHIGSYTQVSDCVDNQTFASPYDVALDGAGALYVLDTSCRRLQKYNASTGTHLGTIWRNYPPSTVKENLFHGFIANYAGDMIVPEQSLRYHPSAIPTTCGPDIDVPTISTVSPATTWQPTVAVSVTASDGCSAVETMRITGDVVTSTAWQPYANPVAVQLTTGDGAKTLNIMVRDHYLRESSQHTVTLTLDTTIPPLIARQKVSIPGPRTGCWRRPLRFLAKPSRYRLLDGCAVVSGTLLGTTRLPRGGRIAKIQLSLAVTQQLYANARQPVILYAVASKRLLPRRPLKVGRLMTVTGAIVVEKASNSVSVAPVFSWSGR